MKVVSLRQTLQNHQFIFNLQEKSRAAILTDISREVAIKPKTISTALLNQKKNINQEITRQHLDIKKQLVVFSACETGSGKLQKGEGIISLARAFMYAGCPSVITTLWNAHDEATAFLSRKLYEYLKKDIQKTKLFGS